MKWSKQLAGAALSLGLAFSFGGVAQAGLLTFDGSICLLNGGDCFNGSSISQGYGDEAFLDVQYNRDIAGGARGALGSEMFWWDDNYNDLDQVAYGSNGLTPEIFLSPEAGHTVTLLSLDLGAWLDAIGRGSSLRIVDGNGNDLVPFTPLLIGQLGNIHNHFDFNLTSANGIGIQFGPDGYNVGIDNVSFAVDRVVDGGVPEPASWALMLLGFAGLGAVMRRRRLAPVAA